MRLDLHHDQRRGDLRRIGVDDDGAVARAEGQNDGMTDFYGADRDGDGQLDQSEFARRIATTSTAPTSARSSTFPEPTSDDTTPLPSLTTKPGTSQGTP